MDWSSGEDSYYDVSSDDPESQQQAEQDRLEEEAMMNRIWTSLLAVREADGL